MGRTVEQVMTRQPTTLSDTASCMEAAKRMRDEDIGAVIVTASDGTICGLTTDRDIVIRCIAEGMDPATTSLGDICSQELVAIAPDDEIHDAVEIMRSRAIRRVPVLDRGKPVGIVSLGDLAISEDPRSALGTISQAPANH